ncbi:hypothetical protein KFK09_026301 [Dendrobium nobile]|uniref:Uncharacterized protein n=1 Tax=Dendrobium nobile TaxID=94219 RepID=A0A8T3A670_DENNO|nr:hypothetical protein KFK09_026301 [Dendrobium nobile]
MRASLIYVSIVDLLAIKWSLALTKLSCSLIAILIVLFLQLLWKCKIMPFLGILGSHLPMWINWELETLSIEGKKPKKKAQLPTSPSTGHDNERRCPIPTSCITKPIVSIAQNPQQRDNSKKSLNLSKQRASVSFDPVHEERQQVEPFSSAPRMGKKQLRRP